MIKRVIEVGAKAHLHFSLGQLVVENAEGRHTVPVEDIGFLILDNPAVTHSSALFAKCLANQVAVLICDERHLPAGMLLPMCGHSTQAAFVLKQAAAGQALKKRLWKQIVQAKLRAQIDTATRHGAEADALRALAGRVRAGDPDNREAQAAKVYFRLLFGADFRRLDADNAVNGMLNYGYAVMRAACARALVGAGLNLSFGIHHHNQYDAFCLADDVMEPLRPLVDWKVRELARRAEGAALDRGAKNALLGCLSEECRFDARRAPLMVLLQDYAASVRRGLFGEAGQICFPVAL